MPAPHRLCPDTAACTNTVRDGGCPAGSCLRLQLGLAPVPPAPLEAVHVPALPPTPRVDLVTDVRWRADSEPKDRDGRTFAWFVPYLTKPTLKAKLDEWMLAAGGTWSSALHMISPEFAVSSITLHLAKSTFTRSDAGAGDHPKATATDAFKRCAQQQWGIGEELLELPAVWAPAAIGQDGRPYADHDTTKAIAARLNTGGHAGVSPAAPADDAPQPDAHTASGDDDAELVTELRSRVAALIKSIDAAVLNESEGWQAFRHADPKWRTHVDGLRNAIVFLQDLAGTVGDLEHEHTPQDPGERQDSAPDPAGDSPGYYHGPGERLPWPTGRPHAGWPREAAVAFIAHWDPELEDDLDGMDRIGVHQLAGDVFDAQSTKEQVDQ